MKRLSILFISVLLFGRSIPEGYISPIPADVLTKPETKVHFGILHFNDGIPTPPSKQKIADELAYMRLSELYFENHEAVWLEILNQQLERLSITPNKTLAITASPITSKVLWPMLDPRNIYTVGIVDTRNSPVIVRMPEDIESAVILDHYGNKIASLKKNGDYLLYGPNENFVPSTQMVRLGDTEIEFKTFQSPTYTNFLFIQTPREADIERFKSTLRIIPKDVNTTYINNFTDISNTTSIALLPKSARFFKLLDTIVQNDTVPEEKAKQTALAGIAKNKPFQPDMHQRLLLQDAAHSAGIILSNTPKLCRLKALDEIPNHKARFTLYKDEKNDTLDGGNSYVLHIPPNLPAQSWSVTLYDTQTASMLQNPLQPRPYILSNEANLHYNYNGSIDIHFSPQTNDDDAGDVNTIKSVPGKNFFVIVRFYNLDQNNSQEQIHLLLQKLENGASKETSNEKVSVF